MKKYLLIIILLIIKVSLIAQEEITMKASASIEFPVNKISVIFDVVTSDTDKNKVNEENQIKSLNILKMLEKYEYKKDDITTRESRLRGDSNTRRSNQNQYTSTNRYSFILTNLDYYDTIKKELIENGAEMVGFTRILENEEEYKKKAYIKAINGAKRNAELIIKDFSKKKIRLKKIIDGGMSYREVQNHIEDDLLKSLSSQRAYMALNESERITKTKTTMTKLTGQTKVNLLLVFEIIK